MRPRATASRSRATPTPSEAQDPVRLADRRTGQPGQGVRPDPAQRRRGGRRRARPPPRRHAEERARQRARRRVAHRRAAARRAGVPADVHERLRAGRAVARAALRHRGPDPHRDRPRRARPAADGGAGQGRRRARPGTTGCAASPSTSARRTSCACGSASASRRRRSAAPTTCSSRLPTQRELFDVAVQEAADAVELIVAEGVDAADARVQRAGCRRVTRSAGWPSGSTGASPASAASARHPRPAPRRRRLRRRRAARGRRPRQAPADPLRRRAHAVRPPAPGRLVPRRAGGARAGVAAARRAVDGGRPADRVDVPVLGVVATADEDRVVGHLGPTCAARSRRTSTVVVAAWPSEPTSRSPAPCSTSATSPASATSTPSSCRSSSACRRTSRSARSTAWPACSPSARRSSAPTPPRPAEHDRPRLRAADHWIYGRRGRPCPLCGTRSTAATTASPWRRVPRGARAASRVDRRLDGSTSTVHPALLEPPPGPAAGSRADRSPAPGRSSDARRPLWRHLRTERLSPVMRPDTLTSSRATG